MSLLVLKKAKLRFVRTGKNSLEEMNEAVLRFLIFNSQKLALCSQLQVKIKVSICSSSKTQSTSLLLELSKVLINVL